MFLWIFVKVPRDFRKSSERFQKKFREIFVKVWDHLLGTSFPKFGPIVPIPPHKKTPRLCFQNLGAVFEEERESLFSCNTREKVSFSRCNLLYDSSGDFALFCMKYYEVHTLRQLG